MAADQTNFTSVKKEFKIFPFPQYVVRTPLFPLSFYLELLEDYTREKAISKYRKPIIKEALNLASPELTKELNKWAEANCFDEKTTALELALLKYIARMSSRCTPFGLFAGCSVGKIGHETNIVLEITEKHKRFTQFDMQFWVALLQNIATRKTAIYHLKYYPNSSIYEFGSFYRYVEYKYIKTKREHSITGLRKSEVLKEIILKAKSGLTINEMVLLLADDDSEKEEAKKFIIQLIDFQFLISELDPSVTGNNENDRVLSILRKIPDLKNEYQFLETINKHLLDLDNSLIPTPKQYSKSKNTFGKEGLNMTKNTFFRPI